MASLPRRRAGARVVLLSTLVLCGCGGGDAPPDDADSHDGGSGVKVALVGIDGATFSVIDPLVEAGRLPQLETLMEEGSRAVLQGRPGAPSPELWTTIATGRPRRVHGIRDFLVSRGEGPRRLVTANLRRVPALWNLADAAGTSGFAGWWVTWPAEAVDGWMVSDRFARGRWSEWTGGVPERDLVHPPELEARLRPLVVDPMDPPLEELEVLVEMTPEERAELLAATRPVYAHGWSVLKFAYCAQRTYERVTLELLGDGQPDLLGVLLIAVDPVSHTFWHFHQPGAFQGVDAAAARRLGGLVPAIYEHDDRFLGRLRRLLDPDTVILVVSDHGFQASGVVPRRRSLEEVAASFHPRSLRRLGREGVAVGQSGHHHSAGILVAAGGPIRPGVRTQARQLDVAPTVLALLGLPVAEDMPGRVLEEILEPEFLRRHPVRRIPSYDGLPMPAREGPEGVQDEEAVEMLRALGYVD